MATQRSGQPQGEGGEHGSVRPVQAWSWAGAAQDGDLVAEHDEFDVLGGGRSAHQQEESERLLEDQIEQPQRHVGIMPNQRSPLVRAPGLTSGTPHAAMAILAAAPTPDAAQRLTRRKIVSLLRGCRRPAVADRSDRA
jgi:hypothetical protein